jgi:hypothetical protein
MMIRKFNWHHPQSYHILIIPIVCYVAYPINLSALQRVQNWAAKVVLQKSKHDSSTEALKVVQWQSCKQRRCPCSLAFFWPSGDFFVRKIRHLVEMAGK